MTAAVALGAALKNTHLRGAVRMLHVTGGMALMLNH